VNELPERITIIGLGLMGGSLAKALKRHAHAPRITAYTAEPYAGERALAEGAIDASADTLEDAIAGAALVVFATPVDATLALLASEAERLKAAGAVVTDVGSVKAPIVAAARAAALDRFVGGHPLCGSEQSGYQAARADLYDRGMVYVVRGADGAAHRLVAALWEATGARVAEIDAATHDRRMAWVSHVPQILASALADTLADRGIAAAALGPGGSGMVRLASSAPALWTEILHHNREEVVPALRAFALRIAAFEAAVRDGDDQRLQGLLERARLWREGGRR
jgi:prephenate dehydrogenase